MIDYKDYKVGMKVIHHTGEYSGEQGQLYPSWWPKDKDVRIIKMTKKRCLLEYKDQTRVWADYEEIEPKAK